MAFLTLTLRFGDDGEKSSPTITHVSVGLEGNAPPAGTLGGSAAVETAALDLFNAATAEKQEALKQAVLKHIEDSLP